MEFDSRRSFIRAAGGTAAVTPFLSAGQSVKSAASERGAYGKLKAEVLELFQPVQGVKALKIWAPAADGRREFLAEFHASERLFVGSAMKALMLCERLRQLDSPMVVQRLTQKHLTLDSSVWSPTSPVFNPPNLSGLVTERTAMEAMIGHSDNTATDMVLAQAGPDNVRQFITSAGLNQSMIPDSTRVFFGYLLGVPDYKTFTWEELIALPDDAAVVNPPLNDTETFASSADDLVSFYSRALQGAFFEHKETLNEFRRILALGDVIWIVPYPLGASAFSKGGSIDVPGYHAVCAPGALFFSDRWVYFAFALNWNASALSDPDTVNALAVIVNQILTVVKQRLSES
jgi:beta-lactamase class A